MSEIEFEKQLEELEQAKADCSRKLELIQDEIKDVLMQRNRKSRNIFCFKPHKFHLSEEGTVHIFKFLNNRGASVARNRISYGNRDGGGLFELAVLDFSEKEWGKIDHTTEITGDILGWLTVEDVNETLKKIEELP